ncbi:MAG: hypothetical protein K0S74_705 [Chlamydiales bacterium]|jgi:hypothetical protein|nr:hypothetical protein [Chlamydiales bacterium]
MYREEIEIKTDFWMYQVKEKSQSKGGHRGRIQPVIYR